MENIQQPAILNKNPTEGRTTKFIEIIGFYFSPNIPCQIIGACLYGGKYGNYLKVESIDNHVEVAGWKLINYKLYKENKKKQI